MACIDILLSYLSNWEASLGLDLVQGRDSTRKIQRAIAAGELRKQLPSLLTDVSIALDDYRDCCGRHFIFDDKDYQVGFPNFSCHSKVASLFALNCMAISTCQDLATL